MFCHFFNIGYPYRSGKNPILYRFLQYDSYIYIPDWYIYIYIYINWIEPDWEYLKCIDSKNNANFCAEKTCKTKSYRNILFLHVLWYMEFF